MESGEFIMYAGILIIAIVAYVTLTRWIFDIPKRNRHLEAQTKLLAKIAEKQGVSGEEIETISQV